MSTNDSTTPAQTPSSPSSPQSQNALLASQEQQSFSEYITGFFQRIRAGDLGPLPILVGIVLIIIIFQTANANFLSARNFVNLILQMAGTTMIAYGVVFVLLLGEIDLSVGYVSAIGGVLMTVLVAPPYSYPWYSAVGLALLAVLVIGLMQGLLIIIFQLPSFIVTLAGLLVWSGVVLVILGEGGTINIENPLLSNLASSYLSPELGWILAIVLVVGFAFTQYLDSRRRKSHELNTKPLLISAVEVIVLAIVLLTAVAICNADRGVPVIGAGVILVLIILTYVTQNTRFGRYVYAVGGNKEAARRAGIRVERIRVYVFMISSFMAGLGGIILASRLRSVASGQGSGDLLLDCIAAAVIGGTSLFGGRGYVSSAVIGALIIASVQNGMGLLGLPASIQSIITGCVLLMAVIVDSISRRNQKRSGLA